jgi:TolB-like protein
MLVAVASLAIPAAVRAMGAPDEPAVAIVADFANTSRDRHMIVAQAATDAVATELKKRGVYDVVSRREVDKTAAKLGIRQPYAPEDYTRIAKELGATLIVSGEVREINASIRGTERQVEVALVVRAREAETGDMLNGAAVKAIASAPGGAKSEGELGIDAAALAANRAASQMEAYQPITGTIMNSVGNGPIMLNRGVSHGVKAKQEFIVLRAGKRVGRVQARRPSSSYTELDVLENGGGIQPQDRVISLFPEPRFGR